MSMATQSNTSPSASFTPALKPPAGVVSNPDHPVSLVRLADIAIGICITLATLFFALRTYARAYVKRVWLFEDTLVTISWAGTVAYCAIMRATMARHGGEHGWDITAIQAHRVAYWFHVGAIMYGVVICVTKVSILCLYRRVFSPIRWSRFDIVIITLIVVMVTFYGTISLLKIFECSPREKIWNKSVPGKCVAMSWILNVSGGFNTITDYVILLLPIRAVHKLQMDYGKKVLVVLAFTFGLCAPVFATAGFVARVRNTGNPDTSWSQPKLLLWAGAELASGNLCVCFPEITAIFRKRSRSSGPHRPSATELGQWSEEHNSRKKPPSDPYIPKSLMGTTFSMGGELNYVELHDRG